MRVRGPLRQGTMQGIHRSVDKGLVCRRVSGHALLLVIDQGVARSVREDYHCTALTPSQYASPLLCSSISLAGGGHGGEDGRLGRFAYNVPIRHKLSLVAVRVCDVQVVSEGLLQGCRRVVG